LIGKRADTIHRVNLAIAFRAQAERELIDIALHVFDGEVMIYTVVAALQDGPHAFNPVGVRHAIHILLGAVIHCAMPVAINAGVRRMSVSAEHRIIFDIRRYMILNRACVSVRDDNSLYIAATFAHAEDGGFTDWATARAQFLALVLVIFLAAQVRFVRFDDARQHASAPITVAARFANALKHEPRTLLCDAEFLADLHRRNTLARRGNQVHRIEPLIERDMRALENRASTDSEVLLAREATEVADNRADLDTLNFVAVRARRRTLPTTRLKVRPRRHFVRKLLQEFIVGNRDFHGANPSSMEEFYAFRSGSQVYNSQTESL